MKNLKNFCMVSLFTVFLVSGLNAQSFISGMSLNGSTGLYSIPSGRIGWEENTNFGFDVGHHSIFKEDKVTHIPKVAISLFKFLELSGALDIQPDGFNGMDEGTDFIGGLKLKLPLRRTALALGGKYQAMNFSNENSAYVYSATQLYVAVTYTGSFFDMPAETTVVIGKTFRDNGSDSNIDFGMGFDLVLLPHVFEGFIRWVTDFSNFSYSEEAFGANAYIRGVVNTGFRIDLSRFPPLNDFRAAVDIVMTDAFDQGRAFSAGFVFGIPIL